MKIDSINITCDCVVAANASPAEFEDAIINAGIEEKCNDWALWHNDVHFSIYKNGRHYLLDAPEGKSLWRMKEVSDNRLRSEMGAVGEVSPNKAVAEQAMYLLNDNFDATPNVVQAQDTFLYLANVSMGHRVGKPEARCMGLIAGSKGDFKSMMIMLGKFLYDNPTYIEVFTEALIMCGLAMDEKAIRDSQKGGSDE